MTFEMKAVYTVMISNFFSFTLLYCAIQIMYIITIKYQKLSNVVNHNAKPFYRSSRFSYKSNKNLSLKTFLFHRIFHNNSRRNISAIFYFLSCFCVYSSSIHKHIHVCLYRMERSKSHFPGGK